MANPTLLNMPIARDGNKNTIPTTDNGTTGLLSQQYGWQLINAIPPQQGGKAVKREDFNGALYLLSNLLFYLQKGWQFEWDADQTYYAGCIVKDTSDGKMYQCINDVTGTTAPHSDSTNWDLWDLSAYLPLAGGAMTGAAIRRNVDDDALLLFGGKADGAGLFLFGATRNEEAGSAHLRASTSAVRSKIYLTPNGSLRIVPDDYNAPTTQHSISDNAVVAKSISGSGYKKTADGMLVQWGITYFNANSTTSDLITFPVTFSTGYCLTAMSSSAGRFVNIDNTITTLTSCKLVANNSFNYATSAYWIAIGS